MITDIFLKLISRYSPDKALANDLWLEIFTKYSEAKRHYHNIPHLEALLRELTEVKYQIEDWDTVLFAVYYHDIIYKPSSKSNEEDSAKWAKLKLQEINFPTERMLKCVDFIISTKHHTGDCDTDKNHFLDADLAILGAAPEDYQSYLDNVRQEYSMYPDLLYIPGRKKVLQHFLDANTIYKTPHFTEKYEKQARINIHSELDSLT